MPGPLLTASSPVQCVHGGRAQPTMPNPRVLVGGVPTVGLTTPYVVAGCPFPPPPAANGPCVTASFLAGTVRVQSGGVPLLTASSPATCAPTATPLVILPAPGRVIAT